MMDAAPPQEASAPKFGSTGRWLRLPPGFFAPYSTNAVIANGGRDDFIALSPARSTGYPPALPVPSRAQRPGRP